MPAPEFRNPAEKPIPPGLKVVPLKFLSTKVGIAFDFELIAGQLIAGLLRFQELIYESYA